MEKFHKEPTSKTPHINFDSTTGEFLLEGRSIPENSLEYYRPLMEWIGKYLKNPQPNTVLNVNLEYFNTSTSKCLVELFRKLEDIKEISDVKIRWHYEDDDEDMMESGEDFRKIVRVPIELVKLEQK